jgi:hypothetical protein
MPFIAAGGAILGGLLSGRSARKAAQTQADAQRDAAQLAAEEARFRPVGITTRFGQSQFTTGPDGRVSGASYTLDPALRAMQDRFLGLAGGGLTQAEQAQQQFAPLGQAAQGLFGLGQQYLAQTPQEAAQQFMSRQQELLAPSRERQMAQLQNQLFQTGRGGLAVGATGARPSGAAGLGAASPEMEAYYNALAQQDAALAAQAQEAGMEQARFGAGLFNVGGNLLGQGFRGQAEALAPYEAYMRGATGLETLGQAPLDIGSALGGRNINQAGSQALLAGGMGAARAVGEANAFNPFADFLQGSSRNKTLTDALSKLLSGSGATVNPLSTSAYGFGLPGFEAAQADIYGR